MTEPWIEEFLSLIGSEDITKIDFEKAIRLKEQNLPKSIFKFRAVNDFALKNLSDGTAWFTSPSKYNDPYDCVGTLSYAELARTVSNAPPNYEQALRQHYESIFTSLRETLKISSFCTLHTPILMWSHYADNHRGFCMEYEVQDLPEGIRRILFPVIYISTLFDYEKYFQNISKSPLNFNIFFTLVSALHKAKEWDYESEWRIAFVHNALANESNYAIGFPKAIHLGARVSEADKDKLLVICRKRGIEVHEMRLARDRFELTSNPTPI